MKKFYLLLIWFVVIAAVLVLCAELIRVLGEVVAATGWTGIPFDGVVQHKVGELLIAIPFGALTLLKRVWNRERLLLLIRRTQVSMWLGAILNGVAWLSLRHTKDWHPWCLLLLVFGFVGPWLARQLVGRIRPASSRQTG